MAVERQIKLQQFDIAALVKEQSNLFTQFVKRAYYQKDSDFLSKVVTENLSLEAQLSYRQSQLKDMQEKGGFYVSVDLIDDLKSKITDLKKLVSAKKVRDAFYDSYDKLQSGNETNQQHLNNLNTLLSQTNDTDLQTMLQKEIAQTQADIVTGRQNVLKNQVTLALNDKTATVINKTLNDILKQKGEAISSGQNEWVSSLNLYEQALKKTLNENKIVDAITNFKINAGSASNAYQKLDLLNNQIAGSDMTAPVTIDGVNYQSARDYWTATRNNYLAGIGTGLFNNFFSELQTDYKNHLNAASASGKGNAIPSGVLDAVSSEIKGLTTRPELAPFVQNINDFYGNIMGYGVAISAKAITTQAVSTENWDMATAQLNSLGSRYGIDTTADQLAMQAEKGKQVLEAGTNLTQTAQQLANSENISLEEALKKVQSSGVSTKAISPAEAANVTPQQVAETQVTGKELPKITPPTQQFPTEQYGQQNAPAVAPYAWIQNVFGANWQPAPTFTPQIQNQGYYGAVRLKGGIDVYGLKGNNQFEKMTAESYKNLFGSANQQGIVGEVDVNTLKRLGINV